MTQRILIASDTVDENLYATLTKSGFQVAVERNTQDAIERLRTSEINLLILDLKGANQAVEFLNQIRTDRMLQRCAVLVVAEWGTGQATMALSRGADAFEPKPIDDRRLLAAVEEILQPRLARTARASSVNSEED